MFKPIDLPYAIEELEPVISSRTMEFHYGKHLQGYVDNLNKLTVESIYEKWPLERIVRLTGGAIFNNAGQVLNHNLYFEQFQSPEKAVGDEDLTAVAPRLAAQISAQWGSIAAFKEEFAAKGVSLFGSGWVWLSAKSDGTLVITQEQGAGNPVTREDDSAEGAENKPKHSRSYSGTPKATLRPLLTFDVWEHAYYLDYQNARASYLKSLWTILNWKVIEERYTVSL